MPMSEEGAKVPQETQEARYFDQMVQSYPIHPELFTQLYEEWTTIRRTFSARVAY